MKNKIKRMLVGTVIGLTVLGGAWCISGVIADVICKPFRHVQTKPEILKEIEIIVVEKEVEKIVYVEKKEEPKKAAPKLYKQTPNYNYDITKKSNVTEKQLIKAMGKSGSRMHSYADAIVKAEQKYGINAFYLTATLAYESGWGKFTNGTNNIAGWKGNRGNFSNFNSKEKCIDTVAKHVRDSFVETHGKTVGGVTKRYCTDPRYTENIISIINTLQRRL